jgi:putative phosphoribosyl transferase
MRPESTLQCRYLSARIRMIDAGIPADISIPDHAIGLILFGNGVSKGIHGQAQKRVTEWLNDAGFATVLADLISPEERTLNTRSGELCCGLDLLERRVVAISDWIAMQPGLQDLPVAYFGDGIGAEAVLIAATRRPECVRAVVACGPDLDHIEPYIREVFAPTLVLFGNDDPVALDRQRYRLIQLPETTARELIILGQGKDPLDRTGVEDEVASLAEGWYRRYLG